jgi:hypothetical protein
MPLAPANIIPTETAPAATTIGIAKRGTHLAPAVFRKSRKHSSTMSTCNNMSKPVAISTGKAE